ncbi:hypothetical protein [Nocardia brevicatena]|uniref:hypothetical protein n=1 Tax=Nocardia brevicatena TaxID=37327 RepID=UPI0005943CDA|nr:hypothetical protein [Nocardia brevicatena]
MDLTDELRSHASRTVGYLNDTYRGGIGAEELRDTSRVHTDIDASKAGPLKHAFARSDPPADADPGTGAAAPAIFTPEYLNTSRRRRTT